MRTPKLRSVCFTLLGLCLICVGPGCGSGTSPDDKVEYWEAQFMEGAQVGYSHSQREKLEEDGRTLMSLSTASRITVKRDGKPVTQEMSYKSIEEPGGQVVRLETNVSDGGGTSVARGHINEDVLILETTTRGLTTTHTLPWDAELGGFFADEHSLDAAPMTPGEQRTLRMLAPFIMQIADVQMEATDFEETRVLDENRRLLKIKKTISLPGNKPLAEWIWCDEAGQIIKRRVIGGIVHESHRTSKELALRETNAPEFDLYRATTIKIDPPLVNPHGKRRIVYKVRLVEGDAFEAFIAGPGQSITKIDENTVQITAQARGLANSGELDASSDPPTDADLSPNNHIQSDDELVVALAKQVAPDETDPARLAAAMERFVGEYVRKKDFSRALATAAEVAASRQGDCTEHAVLLAALLRARGLPARVVIGLVGSERDSVFAYHMWNEVWVGDRWVPLDATLGMGGIGAAHLKISHNNLHEVSALAAFLPVFQLLGSLEIEILEME